MPNFEGGSGNQEIARKQAELQRRQEQNKAKQSETMSRRSALSWLGRLGVGAIGLIAAGGGAKFLRGSDPIEPLPAPSATTVPERLSEYAALSERMKPVIEQLGAHMKHFRALIEDPQQQLSVQMRKILLEPIETFEYNEKNPERNYYEFAAENLKQRGEKAFTEDQRITMEHVGYFYYSFESKTVEGAHIPAAYSPGERRLMLNQGFDKESTVDGLVAYHELVHTAWDNGLRQEIHSAEDVAAYTEFLGMNESASPTINVAFEHDAFLREIVMLNILTQGKLAQDAKTGNVSYEEYQQALTVTSQSDKDTLTMLIDLGQIMYGQGTVTHKSLSEFKQEITRIYKKRGIPVTSWRTIEQLRSGREKQL